MNHHDYRSTDEHNPGSVSTTNNAHPSVMDQPKRITVEEAIKQIGFGRFQVKLIIAMGVIWILDSMEFMIAGILGPVLLCEWRISSLQEAFISTAIFVGAAIGSPVLGRIGDVYGRKTLLMFGNCWGLYFAILSAWSPNITWLFILRGLYGFGACSFLQTITYVAEFLPSENRGRRVSMVNLFWACGAMLEVLLAIVVLLNTNWRWWLMCSALPLLLTLPVVFWIPESPRFDLARGRPHLAYKTLQRIAQHNSVMLPMGELTAEPLKPRGKLAELFATPRQGRVTVLCALLWVAGAFTYYGVILMSSGMVASKEECTGGLEVGETGATCSLTCEKLTMENYTDLLWTSLGEFPATLLNAFLIDSKLGRKWTMCAISSTLAICLLLLLFCPGRVLTILLLFIARAAGTTLTVTVAVYTPEAYPTHVRAVAMGVSQMCGRCAVVLSPFIAQSLFNVSQSMALVVVCSSRYRGSDISCVTPI